MRSRLLLRTITAKRVVGFFLTKNDTKRDAGRADEGGNMTQEERIAELAHRIELLRDECKHLRELVEKKREERRDQNKHYIMLAILFAVSYLGCHLLLKLFLFIAP